jgi:hypothetical protein
MAFTLTLANGAATSTATSAKTVTEVANFARLVVENLVSPPPEGLTQTQLNQYYLDALRDETVRYWKQRAAEASLREKEPQVQAIRDQAVLDAAL